MVSCPSCGEQLGTGARFCSRCGSNLDGGTPRPVTGVGSAAGSATGAGVASPTASLRAEVQAEMLASLRQATAGEYDIVDKLGEGGMATVYLAHELALDRRVAIKVMSPALLYSGDEMVERFRREARTAASLSHPNIIPIYAVRLTERLMYFVMKYVEGESLDSVVRRDGPLAVATVQSILGRVGTALGYAHRRGVIHRDIKPANIMLDHDGWPVVTDFGIAKASDASRYTQTGTTIGTPAYMSPEQCMGREITGASDQYALGVVAYELLTGRVPFTADTNMAIMIAHLNDVARPIRETRPDCPEWVEQVVIRMLAKSPADRWPSTEEAVAALSGGAPPVAASSGTAGAGGAQPAAVSPMRPTPAVVAFTTATTRPSPVPGMLTRQSTPASGVTPLLDPEAATSASLAVPVGAGGRPSSPGMVPATTPVTITPVTAAATTFALSVAGGVIAVGETFTAQLLAGDIGGELTPVAHSRWASSDPQVATVSADGLVAALRVGTVRISATLDGNLGGASTELSVSRVGVAAIRVLPPSPTVAIADDEQLSVHVRDAFGVELEGRVVHWRSKNPRIVRVSPDGRLAGVSVGSAEVVATSGGRSASTFVRVTPLAVSTVRITPATVTVQSGEEIRLEAEAITAKGRAVSGLDISWATSDPSVAVVSHAGVVTAKRPGSVKIAAGAGGRRSLAAVTVVRAPK